MQTIFKRVSEWNAKRYDQEYDHKLTIALLREEYREWCEAKTDVERLDAICDVIYVAMGALWKSKLELSVEHMQYAIMNLDRLIDVEVEHPMYLMGTYLDDAEFTDQQGNELWLYYVLAVANFQAMEMGLAMEELIAALTVVCDSNDSKSVKKTASDVKANDGDKGVYFVPPEPRLQAILDNLQSEKDTCLQLKLH